MLDDLVIGFRIHLSSRPSFVETISRTKHSSFGQKIRVVLICFVALYSLYSVDKLTLSLRYVLISDIRSKQYSDLTDFTMNVWWATPLWN